MSKDTNTFIHPMLHNGGTLPGMAGLTKREYFAAMAMQGTIASQTPDESIDPAMCAQWCFEIADAMIAEGSK